MTFVLGLTGSIGMGKSTTAGFFADAGIPVHDADAAVHDLYRREAVAPVGALFPSALKDNAIDRGELSRAVLGDPAALARLETVVHPMVRAREAAFLNAHAAHPLVVLDIPLLLETGGETRCDAVLVVTADAAIQRARVLARPGMTEERFAMIHVKQMPDADKRRHAHFLVDTGHGREAARRQVRDTLRALAGRFGRRREG